MSLSWLWLTGAILTFAFIITLTKNRSLADIATYLLFSVVWPVFWALIVILLVAHTKHR